MLKRVRLPTTSVMQNVPRWDAQCREHGKTRSKAEHEQSEHEADGTPEKSKLRQVLHRVGRATAQADLEVEVITGA